MPALLGFGQVVLPVAHHLPLDGRASALFAVTLLAVTALAARRPLFGVVALLALTPIEFAQYLGGTTTITLGKTALVGLWLGLLLRRASLRALRDRRSRLELGGAVAIVAATALTALTAAHLGPVLRETAKALEYLAIFGATAVAFDAEPEERIVWNALAAVTALVCVSAIVQLWTGAPSGFFLGARPVPRIAGLLEGPNQLSGYLGLAIPLLLARTLGRPFNAPVAAALFLAAATDVLTFSRSGVLAAIVACAVVLYLANAARYRAQALGAAAVFAVLSLVGIWRSGTLARFTSTGEQAVPDGLGTRSQLWGAAFEFWKRSPFLGIGAGNFELELPSASVYGVRTHANSLYLQSLAEGGIVLLCATLYALGAVVWTMLRAPRTPLTLGVAAATVGFAVHGIFDLMTFYPKVGGYWWALAGLGLGALYHPPQPEPGDTTA